MAEKPLASVIIPAYNAQQFLRGAVESALWQTWTHVEVIVVDDCSSDATGRIADGLAAEDSRVRVVHRKQNGGRSAARNTALSIAAGEFVCFLDADDLLMPEKIERQLEFLTRFPLCDLVYSDFYFGDANATPVHLMCRRPPPVDIS